MKQADSGRALLGWGLPSLRWAVAEQWDFDDHFYLRRRPLVLEKTPVIPNLEPVSAIPSLSCRPRRKPWRYIWRYYPNLRISLPAFQPHRRAPNKSRAVRLVSGWLQELSGRGRNSTPCYLRGSTTDFLSRFTPKFFPSPESIRKEAKPSPADWA